MIKGNPIREEVSGLNWYQKVSDIVQKNKMPYYLVWANFGETNFYVPYKYDDNYGHEMINEFIDYYNHSSSIFAKGTNFYNNINSLAKKEVATYNNVHGYMIYPFDMDTILEETKLKVAVKNTESVRFIIKNEENGKSVTLNAKPSKGKEASQAFTIYEASMTKRDMEQIGATDIATITALADDVVISKLTNLSIGKEKGKAPAHVIEDFEYYSGSDGLLDASYSSNSAAGCSSSFILDSTYKIDGSYGGAFNYVLSTTASEVWTGRIKNELSYNDFQNTMLLRCGLSQMDMGRNLSFSLQMVQGRI